MAEKDYSGAIVFKRITLFALLRAIPFLRNRKLFYFNGSCPWYARKFFPQITRIEFMEFNKSFVRGVLSFIKSSIFNRLM